MEVTLADADLYLGLCLDLLLMANITQSLLSIQLLLRQLRMPKEWVEQWQKFICNERHCHAVARTGLDISRKCCLLPWIFRLLSSGIRKAFHELVSFHLVWMFVVSYINWRLTNIGRLIFSKQIQKCIKAFLSMYLKNLWLTTLPCFSAEVVALACSWLLVS